MKDWGCKSNESVLYDDMYGLSVESILDPSEFYSILNSTMTSDNFKYSGITGNVSIDNNGDRQQGLFGYVNILLSGNTEYIGYYYSGTSYVKLDISKIYWPNYFTILNKLPQTNKNIKKKLLHHTKKSFMIMTNFSIISIIISLIYHNYTIILP